MENEKEEIHSLQSENEQLRERVARLERQLSAQQRARLRVVDIFTGLVIGKPLKNSISRFVDEMFDRKLERDTVKEVAYATLHRLTRVGFLTLLFVLAPIFLAILQTYYLKKQNEKLDLQNYRIDQQTYLQEAERRSSLIFLFDDVLDKLYFEVKANPTRELSPLLVARIISLSKAFKPYRYLEGDSITPTQTSPERGQLLMSLISSKLHPATYDKIFLGADFSYAVVNNVSLDATPLRYVNLSHAILENVTLIGCDLTGANFTEATLRNVRSFQQSSQVRGARFDEAKFLNAVLRDCDLSGSHFERTVFTQARLERVFFEQSHFSSTEFRQVVADSLHFGRSLLLDINFSPADKKLWPGHLPLADFDFSTAQLDSASLRALATFPLRQQPVPASGEAQFYVRRDSFFVDDAARPIVVLDSFRVFLMR